MTPGPTPDRDAVHDVVIVGGGVAGLAAASRLAGRDVVLLEESDRLGGRLASTDGPEGSFVNLGAHLLTGGSSSIAELVDTSGLGTVAVPGVKSALWFEDTLYRHRRAELYPFTLPLSLSERWALVRVGLRIRLLTESWRRARRPRPGEDERQYRLRLAGFQAERSFAELLEARPARVAQVFATAARRSSGESDELTVGGAVSIFGALWAGAASRAVRNVRGGAGRLGARWQAELGERAVLEARVIAVDELDDGDDGDDGDYKVSVTYVVAGQERCIQARHVIVCVPAPVAARIISNRPAAVGERLAEVRYGPFVCLGLVTRDIGRVGWDDVYAISTPGLAFDMLFHHSSSSRDASGRVPGRKSLMCYAGGAQARPLLGRSDDEIKDLLLADVERVLPQVRGAVERAEVAQWPRGNSFPSIGRDLSAVEQWNARPGARVHLAGDYFAPLGGTADAAAAAGFAAAAAVGPDPSDGAAEPAVGVGELRHD